MQLAAIVLMAGYYPTLDLFMWVAQYIYNPISVGQRSQFVISFIKSIIGGFISLHFPFQFHEWF